MPKTKSTKRERKRKGKGFFDSIGNAFQSLGNTDTYKPITNAIQSLGNTDTYKPIADVLGNTDTYKKLGNTVNGIRNKVLDYAKQKIPGFDDFSAPWKSLENAAGEAVKAASNKDSWNKLKNDPLAVWREDVNPWLKKHKVLSNTARLYSGKFNKLYGNNKRVKRWVDDSGYGLNGANPSGAGMKKMKKYR